MAESTTSAATARTKIDRLTSPQHAALTMVLSEQIKAGTVVITATTAQFALPPAEALELVMQAQARVGDKTGRRGHPYQSLHGVVRKLSAAAK